MPPKPLSPLTRRLRFLLKGNVVLLSWAILPGLLSVWTYAKLSPDVEAAETMFLCDYLTGATGLVQVAYAILLAVFFLRWIHRANRTIRARSSVALAFTPGWAVGWYFIPIANLFKPYQAMKEMWLYACGAGRPDAGLVGWWWFLWIVSNVLGRIVMKLSLRADSRADLLVTSGLQVMSDGIDIILNLVALALITRIGTACEERYPDVPPSPAPPPPLPVAPA